MATLDQVQHLKQVAYPCIDNNFDPLATSPITSHPEMGINVSLLTTRARHNIYAHSNFVPVTVETNAYKSSSSDILPISSHPDVFDRAIMVVEMNSMQSSHYVTILVHQTIRNEN